VPNRINPNATNAIPWESDLPIVNPNTAISGTVFRTVRVATNTNPVDEGAAVLYESTDHDRTAGFGPASGATRHLVRRLRRDFVVRFRYDEARNERVFMVMLAGHDTRLVRIPDRALIDLEDSAASRYCLERIEECARTMIGQEVGPVDLGREEEALRQREEDEAARESMRYSLNSGRPIIRVPVDREQELRLQMQELQQMLAEQPAMSMPSLIIQGPANVDKPKDGARRAAPPPPEPKVPGTSRRVVFDE